MAQYITTGEELTSVADAIRAKTGGNSPLVYPTGFVNAINGLSHNWLGEDAELIDTVHQETVKLSDTTFNASSVSTSNTTIYNGTTLNQIYLPATYDYIIKSNGIIDYQYDNDDDLNGKIIEGYTCSLIYVYKKPNTPTNYNNNSFTYASVIGFYNNHSQASTGYDVWTNNNYGILVSAQSPSLANAASDPFGLVIKTPRINVNYNNTYMTQAAYQALNTNNTTITIKVELYRCKPNNLYRGFIAETTKLYQQKHNLI